MQQDLTDLLTIDIPGAPILPDSFLDITWQGHKENIISRIYGYFLNPKKNAAIAELFMNTLLELIKEHCDKSLKFETYTCQLEESTDKGNRIDLLIRSPENEEAIIIENKIYHVLNNDLSDYWNYIKYPENQKVGIVLSLNKTYIPDALEGNFINITHIEWINRIKQRGLPSGITTNEFIYLNDFINNIERLSKSQTMNEQTKFFFNNPEKVLTAIDTYTAAKDYITTQLQIAAEKMGWELDGKAETYTYITDMSSNAYYTIIYDKMLSKEKKDRAINIIIELYQDAIKQDEALRKVLSDNTYYKRLYTNGSKTPYWIHFVSYEYPVSDNELENLGEFVYEKIKEHFEPVMSIILKELNK